MKIDWMKSGAEYSGTRAKKERLLAITDAIDRAEKPIGGEFDAWLPVPTPDQPPLKLGMMQGMGIKAAIKQYRIPNVSHIAVSTAGAPYGLYGIRGNYIKDGPIDIWFMDDGVSLTTILAKYRDDLSTPSHNNA
jgi:hypothetical protein